MSQYYNNNITKKIESKYEYHVFILFLKYPHKNKNKGPHLKYNKMTCEKLENKICIKKRKHIQCTRETLTSFRKLKSCEF